jgi:hypothetical protein
MMCREEQATSPHAGEAKEPAAPPAVKPGVLDATQVLSGSSAVDGDGDDDKDGGAEGGGTEDGAGRRKDDFVIEKPTLKNEPPVYSHAQRKQRERVHELYEQMQRINQAKREAATLVRLLADVATLVASDVSRPRSSVLAVATLVRLLACVHALVRTNVGRRRRSVLAVATLVRLLACVPPFVHSDVSRPSRSVLAETAPVRLLAASLPRRTTPFVAVAAVCCTHTPSRSLLTPPHHQLALIKSSPSTSTNAPASRPRFTPRGIAKTDSWGLHFGTFLID